MKKTERREEKCKGHRRNGDGREEELGGVRKEGKRNGESSFNIDTIWNKIENVFDWLLLVPQSGSLSLPSGPPATCWPPTGINRPSCLCRSVRACVA